VKEYACRLEDIDIFREIRLQAAALEDFHQQPDGPVVELQHALRDAGLGLRRRSQGDRGQVSIRHQQLVLDVKEVAKTICGRPTPIVEGPKPGPGLLLHIGELFDEQLLFALHMAIDRTRAHTRSFGDGSKRRAIEATLQKQRSGGLSNSGAAATSARQPTIIGA